MAPKKSQKMSLGTFLQDESLGSWADEMEDMPLPSTDSRPSYATERRAFSSAPFMGNDRRDGYPPREQLPLPTQPPYTAHLANLSFDVTQAEINDFFRDCEVTNVRIVEDKIDRKPKGFGYVEFATLDGLKKALALSGAQLNSRNIRVSVAEPPKERQDTARDFTWERKGPLPELANQNRRVSDRPGYGRNFDTASDAGSERGGRRNMDPVDGKVRDFSTWERKGPLSPVAPSPPTLREGGRQGSKEGTGFRRNSPAWGEGRSQEGSRPRKEFQEKPIVERQPTASELDNQWRSRMRPDPQAKSPTPETSAPSSPAPVSAVPAQRPRLQLQKRTVSEAVDQSAVAAADSKASPFGAARPVDTAARERELAEKRELTLQQKREADEKAKAERAEEKRQAKEKEREKDQVEAAREKDPHELEAEKLNDKEDEEEGPAQPGPKFDILRRADSNTNDMVAPEEQEEEEEEENAIVDDKAVKPREIVRETRPTKANGTWRKDGNQQAQQQQQQAQTTAETMEEDGWSTVSKPTKQRNNRRNNMPTRALAS